MGRILVAIDGSEHSQRAVRYAARRAQETGCKIDLLHVERAVMAWEVGPVSSSEAIEDLRVARSAKVLDEGAGQFGEAIQVERHAVTGDPAQVILEQADKLGVDEIVIGSRGLRPWGAVVLGSVAYKVLHEANVAVVVVR